MKIRFNYFLAAFAVMALTMTTVGCKGSDDPSHVDDSSTPDASEEPEPVTPGETMDIFDADGNALGAIDQRAQGAATDAGILYSVLDLKEYESTGKATYRFFRTEDRKDILMGTLDSQGYEALFSRTEIGGVIYTLAVSGNVFDSDPDKLWLLAFNPQKEKMDKVLISDNGFPYTSMAAVGGKLLIMNHEMSSPKYDKVYKFDPSGGSVKEILSFDSSENSLRSICADGDGFRLLRVNISEGDKTEVFLDSYDRNYAKVQERSIDKLLFTAGCEIDITKEDAAKQPLMNVSKTYLSEGRYFFYENFSTLRTIVDLESESVVLAKNDLWSLSIGSGTPVFYLLFPDDVKGEPWIYSLQDGKAESLPLTLPEDGKRLESLSFSPSGNCLARLVTSDGSKLIWTKLQ